MFNKWQNYITLQNKREKIVSIKFLHIFFRKKRFILSGL